VNCHDIGHLAAGDDAGQRQPVVAVKHRVQTDRTSGSTELRPFVQRQVRSAVGESRPTSHFFEAEFLLAYRLGNNGEQLGKHPLEQLPGPIAIGAGRIRAHRRFDAKMRQLALTALEPLFNFPQPIRLAQFAKKASWRNDSNSTGFCNGTATQFLSRGAESRYAESARVLG
jgi:hypothetical protein